MPPTPPRATPPRDNPPRAVQWSGTAIRVIDQTRLPHDLVIRDLTDVDSVVDAIARLVVRGAPALGAVGALGVLVALDQATRERWADDRLTAELDRIRRARPTAVNLARAVDQVSALIPTGRAAVLGAALELLHDDERANREIGRRGADWICARVPRRPVRVLTHCNAGLLATTAWGTALGVIRELNERGALGLVHVDETRPLLQGARLTAWELAMDGIDHVVQVDAAAAGTILSGLVDVAVIGADRIAANGDTANKVGSVGVALACVAAGIPFVVAAPESTLDLSTASGAQIEIELRDEAEVLAVGSSRMAPAGTRGFNPAFDITPARYISALVTQSRVIELDHGQVIT